MFPKEVQGTKQKPLLGLFPPLWLRSVPRSSGGSANQPPSLALPTRRGSKPDSPRLLLVLLRDIHGRVTDPLPHLHHRIHSLQQVLHHARVAREVAVHQGVQDKQVVG